MDRPTKTAATKPGAAGDDVADDVRESGKGSGTSSPPAHGARPTADADLVRRVDHLAHEVQAMERELEQRKLDLETQGRLVQAELRRNEAEAHLQKAKLEFDLETTSARKGKLDKELEILESRLHETTRAVERLRLTRDELEADGVQITARHAQTTKLLTLATEELTAVEQAVSRKNEDQREIETSVMALREDRLSAQRSLDKIVNECDVAKARLDRSQKECDSLEKETKDRHAHLEKLLGEVAATTRRHTEMEQNLQDAGRRHEDIEEKHARAVALALRELEAARKTTEQEIESLTRRLARKKEMLEQDIKEQAEALRVNLDHAAREEARVLVAAAGDEAARLKRSSSDEAAGIIKAAVSEADTLVVEARAQVDEATRLTTEKSEILSRELGALRRANEEEQARQAEVVADQARKNAARIMADARDDIHREKVEAERERQQLLTLAREEKARIIREGEAEFADKARDAERHYTQRARDLENNLEIKKAQVTETLRQNEADYERRRVELEVDLTRRKTEAKEFLETWRDEQQKKFSKRYNQKIQAIITEINATVDRVAKVAVADGVSMGKMAQSMKRLVTDILLNNDEDVRAAQIRNTMGSGSDNSIKDLGYWFKRGRNYALYGIGAILFVFIVVLGFRRLQSWLSSSAGANSYVETVRRSKMPMPYAPRQTTEFQLTYTDNFLVNGSYRTLELDQNFRSRWIVDLNTYLTGTLYLSDRTIVRIIPIEKSLIVALDKLLKEVDGRDPDPGIQKMRQSESAAQVELEAQLGGRFNYQRFYDFKRQYYVRAISQPR